MYCPGRVTIHEIKNGVITRDGSRDINSRAMNQLESHFDSWKMYQNIIRQKIITAYLMSVGIFAIGMGLFLYIIGG